LCNNRGTFGERKRKKERDPHNLAGEASNEFVRKKKKCDLK
jgi:hypothetical protein